MTTYAGEIRQAYLAASVFHEMEDTLRVTGAERHDLPHVAYGR